MIVTKEKRSSFDNNYTSGSRCRQEERGKETGFTLLELVLATLIASLVIGILSVALTFSLRVWEREQNRETSEAPSMVELLKWQLACIDLVDIRSEGESHPLFQGEENSIAFATDFSVKALSKGAPVVVRYVYSPGEKRLYYAEIPLDPYHPEPIEAFLDMEPSGGGKQWPVFYSVEMTHFELKYEKAEEQDANSRPANSNIPDIIEITWMGEKDSVSFISRVRPNSFFPKTTRQDGLEDSSSFE